MRLLRGLLQRHDVVLGLALRGQVIDNAVGFLIDRFQMRHQRPPPRLFRSRTFLHERSKVVNGGQRDPILSRAHRPNTFRRMTSRSRPPRSVVPAVMDHVWPIAGVVFVTVLVFWPVLRNDFVNWDDPAVILQNPRLSSPDLVAWAFSTRLIGHYQ